MTYVAWQHKPSSQTMRGFFGVNFGRQLNDIQMLDARLRDDIGLAQRAPIQETSPAGDDTGPTAASGHQIKIADIRRTSARAFAMPLAITGSFLG